MHCMTMFTILNQYVETYHLYVNFTSIIQIKLLKILEYAALDYVLRCTVHNAILRPRKLLECACVAHIYARHVTRFNQLAE